MSITITVEKITIPVGTAINKAMFGGANEVWGCDVDSVVDGDRGEDEAAVACGETQSSGGLRRAEQFIMAGQGMFTARYSLRQDDFTAKQRCRQGGELIFGCMGLHNGMKVRQMNRLESSEYSLA